MKDRGSSQASAAITGKDKLFLVRVTSKIVQFPPVHVALLLLRVVMKCAMSYFWYDSVNSSIWFLLRVLRRDQGSVLDSITKTDCNCVLSERLGTRINLQICFSQRWKKKPKIWVTVPALRSTQLQHDEVTKQGRGLKPLPTSKCCSRPQSWEHPGLALSCRGVLNPTAFPTQ